MRLQQVGQAQQQALAVGRPQPRPGPAVEGAARGLHRGVHIGRGSQRHAGDALFIGGVEHVQRAAFGGGHPLAVDQHQVGVSAQKCLGARGEQVVNLGQVHVGFLNGVGGSQTSATQSRKGLSRP